MNVINNLGFIESVRNNSFTLDKYLEIDNEFIENFNKNNNFSIVITDKNLYDLYIKKCFRYILSYLYLKRLNGYSRKYYEYAEEITKQGNYNIEDMDFKLKGWMTKTVVNAVGWQSKQYYSLLEKHYNFDLQNNIDYLKILCNKDDNIGKPPKENHKMLGNICGNNIQYIYESFQIIEHFKKLNLNDINIIEIGGGYGGLAFYLINICKKFNINIKSYTIFDIPESNMLQTKYFNEVKIKAKSTHLDDNYNIYNNSFLISNYCFGEIEENYQKKYNDKIFEYVSHGFICWNFSPFNYHLVNNIKFENDIVIDGQDYRNNDIIIRF